MSFGYPRNPPPTRMPSHTPPERNPPPVDSAPCIMRKAAQHMEDRAAARDQAGGERSMKRTVDAFNAITGSGISERDGWLFMALLKAARACTTDVGLPDDYEDGAAYFALAGECAAKHRKTASAEDKL